jgi:uncharacterized protein (TIGR02270 family)
VSAALEDEDDRCRFWGAWSAVRLGAESGIPVLGRFATEGGPLAAAACDMGLRALAPEQAVRTHARLLSVTKNERLGVLAAGIIGDRRLGDWLLDKMASPPLARAAGAAFCLMTGRDLRRDDLDCDPPPGASSLDVVSTETLDACDPDSDVDDLDADLSWPDQGKVGAWWDANRRKLLPGVRYLAGELIGPSALLQVLRTGNQQQRGAAALELARLEPNARLFDVAAPAHCQADQMKL